MYSWLCVAQEMLVSSQFDNQINYSSPHEKEQMREWKTRHEVITPKLFL